MKTIAITIDEDVPERVDRLARRGGHARDNRSRIIQDAVREYVACRERIVDEEREAAVIQLHRGRVAPAGQSAGASAERLTGFIASSSPAKQRELKQALGRALQRYR